MYAVTDNFIDIGFIFDGKEINKDILESVIDATSGSDLNISYKVAKKC